MHNFKKFALLLAGTAFSAATMTSVAVAAPIDAVLGTTASSTQNYLSIHAGVAGAGVVTHQINMPTAACTNGGGVWCFEPQTFGSGGYQGSDDRTWQQMVGPTLQTLTWGTSNGNVSPAQGLGNDSGGSWPFDGTGNSPALNGGSMLSWTGSTSFGDNGTWDGSTPYIAINTDSNVDGQTDTVYLVFNTPIAGFSALFNFNPNNGTTGLVQGLDASGTQTGSDAAAIDNSQAGTNGGVILGFLNSTADIYIIAISDAYSVMTNISITYGVEVPPPAAVPEPISLVLLGTGLLGLGVARRYRWK